METRALLELTGQFIKKKTVEFVFFKNFCRLVFIRQAEFYDKKYSLEL